MIPAKLKYWIEAARPKTLPAAIVPVLVGSAMAHAVGHFSWEPAMNCMLFALLIQIGTNLANDYGDYVTGADSADRIGPRRVVSAGLISEKAMMIAALGVLAIAFGIGFGLVRSRGWELLPLGIVCIVFAWSYTAGPFPLAYHGLGDVCVFLFFGIVAVCGTYYVLTGTVRLEVLLASVPVGLLATNILVVNNYRDIVADERAGKHTLVVRYGRRFARSQYAISLAVAGVMPLVLAAMAGRPILASATLAVLPEIPLARGFRTARDGPALNAMLARSAGVLLLFGVVWAAVLAFG